MGRRLIDADALIELIDDDIASLDKIDMSREGYDVCLCTLQMVKLYIKVLPAVEAVPLEDYRSMEQTVYKLTQALAEAEPIKHGRWETPKGYPNVLLCSECNTPYEKKEFVATPNYCPNCGADMREVEE